MANPKSQIRMDSGFPDSSMYRMLLGFRSRWTTWKGGGQGWSRKGKGEPSEEKGLFGIVTLSRSCGCKPGGSDAMFFGVSKQAAGPMRESHMRKRDTVFR